jgi:hypothetical protein
MTRYIAYALSVILIVIGAVGFIINPDLNVLEMDLVHNLFHLIMGGILLLAGYVAGRRGAMTMLVSGIIFGIVAVLSIITSGPQLFALFQSNFTGSIFHIILTVILIGAGWMGMLEREARTIARDTIQPNQQKEDTAADSGPTEPPRVE